MRSITAMVEELARTFVWKKGEGYLRKDASVIESVGDFYTEKYPKLYGIGVSRASGYPVLEIYADSEFQREILSELHRRLPHVKNVERRIIPCRGFRPYLALGVGDKVKHINLSGYGTLGGFVYDLYSTYLLAISNNHVLANSNSAQIGDDLVNLTYSHIFGTLHRFVPLRQPPVVNTVDVAVGLIYKGQRLKWTPRKPLKSGKGIIGMHVYKYGARTGYTEGVIMATNVAARIDYPNLGPLNFRKCLRIEGIDGPFSLPGDSGSLVISKSGVVVGLLFAGEKDGVYSLANPFSYVEEQLGVFFT